MDINTASLLLIAVLNALTAFMTWKTHQVLGDVKSAVVETKHNVAIVEKSTNGMKDALVAATVKAAHAEGELKGRDVAVTIQGASS